MLPSASLRASCRMRPNCICGFGRVGKRKTKRYWYICGQFLLQELVRQGESLASAARGKAALHQVGDEDEAELQPLRLVHRHQVDGVDGLVQWRNLLVRLRRLGRVEVLEVGGEVVVGMLVAVRRDKLGELLHVGAHLQSLARSEGPLRVQVVGWFPDLI